MLKRRMHVSHLFARRSRYLPMLFLLWAGVVVITYFLWFPLPQPKAERPYLAFLLLAWLVLIAATSGLSMLRALKLHYHSQAERLIFATALGFGVLGYLMFIVGITQALYPQVIYTLLILLTLLSYRELATLFSIIRSYLRRSWNASRLDVMLGAILLFLLTAHFLLILMPPTLFDALVYHLAVPKLYLLEHGIGYYPYNFYSNFPFFLEMLYTLGLILHGPIVVNGISYVMHLLLLSGLYIFARAAFNHRTALWSVLILYTVPWVGLESFLPYIDVGLGCYAWLALMAFLNWLKRNNNGWLMVSGACVGITISIKYVGAHIALIVGLSVLAALFWKHFRNVSVPRAVSAGQRPAIHSLLSFGIPAAILGMPWYVKNLILTGNPVYPFVFGGGTWDAEMLHRYVAEYQMHFASWFDAFLGFVRLPWDLVFLLNTPGNIPIGPIFLIFLPLLLGVRRIPRPIGYLLGVSLAFMLFWFHSSPQSRFLIPILPCLSLAAAYAVEQLAAVGWQWIKRTAYLLLIILGVTNIAWEFMYIHSFFNPFAVVTGLESRDAYLSRQLPDLYPITKFANDTLPPDAKILYLGDSRGYYADRLFIANTGHDRSIIVELVHQAATPDELLSRLRTLGVTHIIFNRHEGTRLHQSYQYFQWKTPQDERIFWECYQQRLKLLHTVNDSDLLELPPL